MPSARKPSLILPVAVTLMVLLGLYVGAYYATVVPRRETPWVSSRGFVLAGQVLVEYAGPFPKQCERAFFPIHWLDRRIRPHVWEPAE